jgi:hypothetical protein
MGDEASSLLLYLEDTGPQIQIFLSYLEEEVQPFSFLSGGYNSSPVLSSWKTWVFFSFVSGGHMSRYSLFYFEDTCLALFCPTQDFRRTQMQPFSVAPGGQKSSPSLSYLEDTSPICSVLPGGFKSSPFLFVPRGHKSSSSLSLALFCHTCMTKVQPFFLSYLEDTGPAP